jgi:hypothetical protein
MSSVQFNLLPDVKLEHDKAVRTKKLVTTVAFLASAISLAIFLILFLTVDVVQKKQLNDSKKAVDSASQQLKTVPQIDQIITVQNQLKTLSSLHANKHITSRIFKYFPKLTPQNVTINKLDVDLKLNTMIISGKANSQQDVNIFVDTLKFATYKVGNKEGNAFNSVVESGFAPASGSIGYTVQLNFDPILFANTMDEQGKPVTPTLTVNTNNSASTLSPSSTLFNSSQSSGGSQ